MSESAQTARRRRLLIAGGLAIVLLAPAGTGLAASLPRTQSAAAGLRYVGAISIPSADGFGGQASLLPVGVDQGLHKMVAIDLLAKGVYQVDTRSLAMSPPLLTKVPSRFAPGSEALDQSTHRLYIGRACGTDCVYGPALGPAESVDPTGSAASVSPPWPSIQMIDLTGSSQPTSFSFQGAPGVTDGMSVVGLRSYGYGGHHYLLALLYFGYGDQVNYLSGAGSSTQLFALDEDKMASDPTHAMLWSAPYNVSACARPGFNGKPGLYLGMATTGDFVYFACRTFGTSAPLPLSFAGPPGVVRIDLGSSDPSKQDPQAFTTEYFPFAADFTFGNTSGDPAHDLLYVVTGAAGPHFFVFDAAHRSFTGSVPLQFSARGGSNIMGAAADVSTGRAYLFIEDFKVIVTDATTLPVQQGTAPPVDWRPSGSQPPVFDPVTHRLFLPGSFFCDVASAEAGKCSDDANVKANAAAFRVYQDDTPYEPSAAEDPDALTHNTPEIDGVTPVDYSAFASSYGARLAAVGGVHGTQGANTYDGAVVGIHDAAPDFPNLPDSDRTLFLGQVSDTELSSAAAKAHATPLALDSGTQADANGVQSYAGSQAGAGGQALLAAAQDQAAPARAEIGQAGCSDLSNKPATEVNPSGTAGAACDNEGLMAAGESTATPAAPLTAPGGVSISLGATGSWTSLTKDKAKGSVATATAVARGVHVSVPLLGSVDIGEVKTTASSAAHGRPGTTGSTFMRSVTNLLIRDSGGQPRFACGFTDPGAAISLAAGTPCDPRTVTEQLDAQFPGRLKFAMPDPDSDPGVAHSPGGAKAAIIKAPFALWNDFNTSHDGTPEVPGLQIQVLNDYTQPSRLVMSLAGVYVESNYKIGVAPPAPPTLAAPSLQLSLTDNASPPVPLSGATFRLQGPEGTKPVTCLTAADGIGTCKLSKLPPGAYTISETAPPPGFAPAEDYKLSLEPGKDYKTSFVNLKAIGSVNVSLSSPVDSAPIPGGVFALLKGSDLLGTPLATCTTDDKGACGFKDVPLGDYTMQQVTAPDGFLVSDAVAFSLKKPAQVADLKFVDGIPGKPPVPPTIIPGTPPVPPKVIPGKPAVPPKFIPGKPAVPPRTMVLPALDGGTGQPGLEPASFDTSTGPAPIVASQPSGAGPLALGSGGLSGVSARLAKLVLHSPQQGVLLLFVWLILGLPVYLWVRRRQFITATEGI